MIISSLIIKQQRELDGFSRILIDVLVCSILLVMIIVGIVGYLCNSDGICRQPNLTNSDVDKLSARTVASATSNSKIDKKAVIAKPVRMLIPSVDLGLDIKNATVDLKKNYWPISDIFAQYANFTPGIGSKDGTMLIYGHNTWPVLAKTNNLEIGDELILIDENFKLWHFTLSKIENVSPDDISFLKDDAPFRVVVLTCSGWDSEYRRLMYFTSSIYSLNING